MPSLKDKTVLIIGRGSGIAGAIALAVCEAGGRVIAAGRNPDNLAGSYRDINVGIEQVDVTDEPSVAALAGRTARLDHVVCTASARARGGYADLTAGLVNASFATKVIGPMLLAKHFAGTLAPDGSFLFMSGATALKPAPGMLAVAATNAAVDAITAGLAVELAPIRVNALAPGTIDTGAYDALGEERKAALFAARSQANPARRIGTADDVAAAALMALTNGFLTGTSIAVDGGEHLVLRRPFPDPGVPLMAVLVSVNVGLPRNVSWQGKTVYTGVWKHPVDGPAMVRRLNIDGDGQGDTNGHGGEQRAVLVYQIQSYRHWERYFGRDDLSHGSFGENLTVAGLADDQVCIGDRYRIGEAEFEVTQPRVTCYRVGLRLGEPELPALLVSHHRPGFYMRVISEGRVQAGDRIIKTRTGPGALSVAEADALLYLPGRDVAKLRLATAIPALSPGWQGSFRELLEAAAGPAGPAWAGFRPLRVTKVVAESATVSSIYLAAPDGSPLPAAAAGQYLTLRITGAGPPAPVRNYSLSSAPGASSYRISVKREPNGAASSYLNREMRPGAMLEAAAPRGDFVLDDGSGPVLLISAGIGVTPVLSMLHALAAAHSTREVWWVHGARGPQEHPLAAEAHALLAGLPNAREHVFYSQDQGRLSKGKLAALGVPADATAYVCGPAAFMADMRQALAAVGIEPARIFTEPFGARPSINPGLTGQTRRPPHQPDGPAGPGPLVTFARSGISAAFGTARRSVLELAEACDVPSRWSCRSGVCHTCVTPLLSGQIRYAPDPLEQAADEQVLICCAQPDTDIVLDM
jgi:ferredoxin-NADP reductase/MOSC domain-containing protein YiiM/NAD(P)-dependent dehydrogenase (short-subunit alcohol dehydrogenase family)